MSKHENVKHDITKHGDDKPKNRLAFKIICVVVFLVFIILSLSIAYNYLRDDVTDKTNLIINNGNITTSLKKNVYIENGIVYLSKEDIANFFDSSIYYDEKYDQIITASYHKIAALPIGKKQIEVNSSNTTIQAGVIKKDETYYLPFSELGDVYNTKTTYVEKNNLVTIDSLDRSYSIATATKNASIKYKANGFSRTVAKVKQGDTYIIANRSDYPVPDGWTRVRTEDGILGYVKTNQMGTVNTLRENMEEKAKVEGTVSLVWDYYSEYASAPDRTGKINGVNVVSPSFFRLKEGGKGEILSNVGTAGEKYIKWAKQNGYQIWPMLANESMINTTSEIMKDYQLREKLINQIVNLITKYELNGINIDFEYMYQADKNYFSRFLIELEPRLNEIGAVLSVDVTAPDGAENWSMCYDRYTIGKVADYIIFMGYDQHGLSSDKEGTTAGCDWVEANITKFLGQEGVDPNKLVLGVPFYTRLWKEQNGKVLSNPAAISMKYIDSKIPNGVEKKWDENLQQYYVEFKQGNITNKMWIEDEKSMEAKLNLISKYKLAGAAYWAKDMEPDSIWNMISQKLFGN